MNFEDNIKKLAIEQMKRRATEVLVDPSKRNFRTCIIRLDSRLLIKDVSNAPIYAIANADDIIQTAQRPPLEMEMVLLSLLHKDYQNSAHAALSLTEKESLLKTQVFVKFEANDTHEIITIGKLDTPIWFFMDYIEILSFKRRVSKRLEALVVILRAMFNY